MNKTAEQNISRARRWLKEDVAPLWIKQGIEAKTGAFNENLSHDGEPLPGPRRLMVQARQIYAFAEFVRLEILPHNLVQPIVERATHGLIERYSLPSGAFVHAVDMNGAVCDEKSDLYGQAFALFGLAHGYFILRTPACKRRAIALAEYLLKERRAPGGGFTEIVNGQNAYQSNPHMHMFEASLAWMNVDPDPRWSELATMLFNLCREKFIDPSSAALCEHFEEGWRPKRENGHFVFEPGHHFEWAWLMRQYQDLSDRSVGDVPLTLYKTADKLGVDPKSRLALDEIWSSGTAKKRSSRFWPQSERIKAAVALGERVSRAEQPAFAQAADDAYAGLWRYLETKKPGLWLDTLTENGTFAEQPVKASSLYHIINALSEYITLRPRVFDGA
jgi:mannose-6-phosphate isomerase